MYSRKRRRNRSSLGSPTICGFKKNFDEPLPLPFRDRTIRVMTQQRSMSTQFARVQIGPTEYLAQPSSQMLGVSRTSLSSKYLRQNRVSEAAPVLRIGQT